MYCTVLGPRVQEVVEGIYKQFLSSTTGSSSTNYTLLGTPDYIEVYQVNRVQCSYWQDCDTVVNMIYV